MDDVSLLEGPLPLVVLALGGLALVVLLMLLLARGGRGPAVALAVAVAVGLAAAVGLNPLLTAVLQVLPDDLPRLVVTWLAVALVAVVLVAGCVAMRNPARRKVLAVGCGVVLLAAVGSQVNGYFAEYPTVGALLGTAEDAGPFEGERPGLVSASEQTPAVARWNRADAGTSRVESAPIPGTRSGFTGRNAWIYLPAAYTGSRPPLLPVLVLVSGQPGGPQDWIVSGRLAGLLDAFAAANAGLAPLTVVVDPNGSDGGNTMCMDSDIAKADTYLAQDVPAWIISTFAVDTNHAHWAFGGWSYGGTCSVQMATRHPDIYPTFIDLAGEREPAITADRATTVQRAFHGDTAAFDALTPLNILARTRFPQVWGYLAAGGNEADVQGWMLQVASAAQGAGINVRTKIVPDQGHSWAVPTAALPLALTWAGPRLGLTA